MSAIRQPSAEPRIQIATVEIRVLKIGSKQMTQAVFNQLERGPLINSKTGLLNGTPWGWVNYKQDRGNQKHFVFERDGKLYRSLIAMRGPNTPLSEYDGDGDTSLEYKRLVDTGRTLCAQLATQRLLKGEFTTQALWENAATFSIPGLDWRPWWHSGKHTWEYNHFDQAKIQPDEIPAAMCWLYESVVSSPRERQKLENEATNSYFTQERKTDSLRRHDEHMARVEMWIKGLQANFSTPTSHLPKLIRETQNAIKVLLDNWQESIDALKRYDQLFIAV